MPYKKEPFPKNAPNIRGAKSPTKTNVRHFPGLGIAPTIKKAKRLPSERPKYNV